MFLPFGFFGSSAPAGSDHMLYVAQTPATSGALTWETGTRFTCDVNGTLIGVRWWVYGPGEAGTHTIRVWTTIGTPITTEVVTAAASAGWQSFTLSSPVPVVAGVPLVISVNTIGDLAYSASPGNGVDNAPLHQGHLDGLTNTTPGTFPTSGGDGLWTFVDPIVHTVP